MDCVVLDDVTFNHYFWSENADGTFKVTRGQVIMAIDFRTLRVLQFGLIPEEQPNSMLAWAVTTRAIREFGIPRALYLERGQVFRNSILMTGGRSHTNETVGADWEQIPGTERELGLRALGIRIITARRARSKPIELVFGLLQNLMDRERGYAGRFERLDRPESVTNQLREVAQGKSHPSRYFYSSLEWHERMGEISRTYNETPQEGKRLNGLSPEQAFKEMWPVEDPPTRLDENCSHLVSNYRKHLVVRGGAASFVLRGETFTYRHPVLSKREGTEVVVWFDPENPEMATVTDRKHQNPVSIHRCAKPNALAVLGGEGLDVLEKETAKIGAHRRHFATFYRTLKASFEPAFRANVVSAEAKTLGEEISVRRKQAIEDDRTNARKEQTGRTKLNRLGLSSATVSGSVDISDAADAISSALRAAEEAESKGGHDE
ncbi:MAG: hypothetical protein JNK85_05475 [Verrucomicrobiales bacterium]|nr:hypothetical protein [Verrucomicrobiales bacterium]